MKRIIILLLSITVLSCTNPIYKKGQVLCAMDSIKVVVRKAHSYRGVGYCGNSTYTCEYVTKLGKIESLVFCEDELKTCE